jgi:hypothetical protein
VPTVADRWPISQMISQDMITDLIGMWEKRATVYESLEGLPRRCATTTSSRAISSSAPTGGVAINWAFCGTGPVGQELGALIGSSQVSLRAALRPGMILSGS